MAHLFLTIKEKIKGDSRLLVKSIEITAPQARKPPSPTHQRVSHWAVRVSVTGFSVTLTGKSVAQSVADQCRFRSSARRYASICRAEALHVFGRKTHVLRTVCNHPRPLVSPPTGTPCHPPRPRCAPSRARFLNNTNAAAPSRPRPAS